MSDNTTLNPGSGGPVIASDDIGGVQFQRVKLAVGNDGVNDGDVSTTNPLPVQSVELDALKLIQETIQSQTEVIQYALMALLDKIAMPDRFDRTRVMLGDNAGNEVNGAYYGLNVASVGDTSNGRLWLRTDEPWLNHDQASARIYAQITVT